MATRVTGHLRPYSYCRRPWPAAYIKFMQNTLQIQFLTEPLCRAPAIFYLLPNNKWGTKYCALTYSAKSTSLNLKGYL